MLKILKNKKIIISAGASGIGWATAKVCLAKGAIVFLCDIEKKYLIKQQSTHKIKRNFLSMNVMHPMNMMY